MQMHNLQRIVGTWRLIDGDNDVYFTTYTFNANGTFSASGRRGNSSGSYFINGTKLIYKSENDSLARIIECYIAPNGRFLVLDQGGFGYRYWYEKQ